MRSVRAVYVEVCTQHSAGAVAAWAAGALPQRRVCSGGWASGRFLSRWMLLRVLHVGANI